MAQSPDHLRRDTRVVLIGITLILLVGAYTVGKETFGKPFGTPGPGTSGATDVKPDGKAPLIAADDLLRKMLNHDPLLIADIRPGDAFRTAHLPHSVSVSIGALANLAPAHDEAVIVVTSAADPQATATAVNILRQKASPFFFIDGGYEHWQAGAYPTVSFGDPHSLVDQSKVAYISADDLKRLLTGPAGSLPFLLDVQASADFQKHHLKGATNIPLEELEQRIGDLPAARNIVVYGTDETASFEAGVRLFDLNRLTTKTLAGYHDLTTLGLPLEP